MKIFNLYFYFMILILCISCSNDDDKNKEINKIELNKRIAKIDNIITSDYIEILDGNGGYKVIVKDIIIDESFENIPFENHTKIHIEGNKIIANRVLLKDFTMIATCVLVDSEGVKKTFVIENPGLSGIHDFDD